MTRTSAVKFHAIVGFLGQNAQNLVKKGERHYGANHVVSVTYDRSYGHLQGTVRASYEQRSYKVQVNFEGENVVDGLCECVNGRARCGHMAALLVWAHNELSSTDVTCAWSARKDAEASAVKTVDEMYPRKEYSSFRKPVNKQMLKDTVANAGDCKGGGAGHRWLLLDAEPEPEEETIGPAFDVAKIPFAEDVLCSEQFKAAEDKVAYLTQTIGVTWDDTVQIAEATVGQSSNPLWHRIRSCRLTAANFGKVLRSCRTNRSNVSILRSLYSAADLDHVRAVMWGRTHEEEAVKLFEEKSGLKVKRTGIWLDPCGFLGASPDGLIGDDSIIEVKCPYKYRDNDLKDCLDETKEGYDSSYAIKWNGEEWVLKDSHEYYHQIMGQLAITRRRFVYFVFWTTKSFVCLKVEFAHDWDVNLDILKSFYCDRFAPFVQKQAELVRENKA